MDMENIIRKTTEAVLTRNIPIKTNTKPAEQDDIIRLAIQVLLMAEKHISYFSSYAYTNQTKEKLRNFAQNIHHTVNLLESLL